MIHNNLEDKYDEFIDLLNTLCDLYDKENKDILALPISTAIRVLVHDTTKSISLLKHLNKKNIDFLSTNIVDPNEPIQLGIVRRINVGVKDGIGGESKYWALCDERYFPAPRKDRKVSFDEWWENEKIFISKDAFLARKDIVLSVANKDGGAHFDSKVSENYDAFRYSWSGGSCLKGINTENKRGYDNIPIYPAIRQIGFELIRTLKPNKTLQRNLRTAGAW